MIVIIDYGMGNLHSVKKAFKRIGVEAIITNKAEDVSAAEKLILPGVGHFGKGMKNLAELGLIDLIKKKVLEDKTPILGICLGMQLLVSKSTEGDSTGFGFVDLEVTKIKAQDLKVPHIGWNSVNNVGGMSLLDGIEEDDLFYFVHSFWVNEAQHDGLALGITTYYSKFTAMFSKDNVYGVQFHPEKSHDQGLRLLVNFSRLSNV